MPRLVGERALRVHHVEIARALRQVQRLEPRAAFVVNDVEAVHDPDEVAHVLVGARPAPAVEIARERRSGRRAEGDSIATDGKALRGITRLNVEFRGEKWQHLFDVGRIESDLAVGAAHACPGAPKNVERLVVLNRHPDVAENPQRAGVNVLDLVRAQHLNRWQSIAHLLPCRLLEPTAAKARSAGCPSASHRTSEIHRVGESRSSKRRAGSHAASTHQIRRLPAWQPPGAEDQFFLANGLFSTSPNQLSVSNQYACFAASHPFDV